MLLWLSRLHLNRAVERIVDQVGRLCWKVCSHASTFTDALVVTRSARIGVPLALCSPGMVRQILRLD